MRRAQPVELPVRRLPHLRHAAAGQIRYAPDPLEPPADGEVLICCAQPDTDIVLDM